MATASLERGFCFDCKVRGIVLLEIRSVSQFECLVGPEGLEPPTNRL